MELKLEREVKIKVGNPPELVVTLIPTVLRMKSFNAAEVKVFPSNPTFDLPQLPCPTLMKFYLPHMKRTKISLDMDPLLPKEDQLVSLENKSPRTHLVPPHQIFKDLLRLLPLEKVRN